jgi:23S rRNA pseudouridine1911/1915/1917 synthase
VHRGRRAAAALAGGGEAAASELEVNAADAGLRLDAFLASRGAARSRSAAQRLIEAGAVLVDGEPRAKNHRVAEGERVSVAAVEESAAAPPPAFEIVYEDPDLLVVDKPAGLVTHPAPGHRGPTLAEALRGTAAGGPDPDRAGIVHRLDRDTSGLLVVAKTEEAYAALGEQLRAREVRREYLALVAGHPEAQSGTIDAPIGRDRARRTVVSTRSDRPREAVTRFEVLERLAATTLLRVRLETGRTHQIRAHMLAIGHPVAGDPEYGHAGLFGLQRQFLHAARLAFTHPVTGERVEVVSQLPPDLDAALADARAP